MSPNFSLKTFLRFSSPELLQQYFTRRQMLSEFDWTLEIDALVDAVYSQIEIMPSSQAAIIEQDFQTISEVADEAGITQLMNVAGTLLKDNADDVIDRMMQHEALMDQVFWMSLEYPDVFEWALRLGHMDKMSSKTDSLVGKHLICPTDDEAISRLKEHIQVFYKKQRRGRYCHIDAYVRQEPTRYCFFAYPEDYPKRDLAYKSAKLIPQVRRPVMEIVFIYEPANGNLKIQASKLRKVEVMQEAFCKAILGLPGIPDSSTQVYDLSKLLDPEFRFVTSPKDHIEEVTLKMLKISIGDDSKVTFEGDPKEGGIEFVRAMALKAITACKKPDSEIKVLSAKIKMQFASVDGGRKKTATFTLTAPSGSTLDDTPHHHLARKYLEKWGLVRILLSDIDEAA